MSEKEKQEIIEVIDGILKRGNDAQVQNRKDGPVVIEQKKTIAYKAKSKE